MGTYTPTRRTFEAAKYPKGSEERRRLNCDPLTSEYMTSYKYVLVDESGKGTCFSYHTKAEAIEGAARQIERELRELYDRQGIPTARQDEIIRDCEQKAQPGAMVGPFVIGQ